jgi:hypothetical protein
LEIKIPFLYEYWNWVGDTSILPTKWLELLKKHDSQSRSTTFSGITRDLLINRYVRDSKFDPQGFFFLTTRSETVSGVLIWPLDHDRCELVCLASLPSHREKETTEAVISLGINYAIEKGFKILEYIENE